MMIKALSGLIALLMLSQCVQRDGQRLIARIDGEKFHHGDWEALIATFPPEQRAQLDDPARKRELFEQFLHQKLFALEAVEHSLSRDSARAQQLEWVLQRQLTQHYYETHLQKNAGFLPEKIKTFHEKHKALFTNDSGKAVSLEDAWTRVTDTMLVRATDLDSFYRANGEIYRQPASCELAYILLADQATANEAISALESGMGFQEAARKFSIDSASASKGGDIGMVSEGGVKWETGPNVDIDSLFFDSTRLEPGTWSRPIAKDSQFVIVSATSCQADRLPELDSIYSRVAADYLAHIRREMSSQALENLKAEYNAKQQNLIGDLDSAAMKKFHEEHKSDFMTPKTYAVYHIEADSAQRLENQIAKIHNLTDFKAAAAEHSSNSWTRPDSGYMGLIKAGYSLPHGVGMMPSLYDELDTLKSGTMTRIHAQSNGSAYHVFWLVETHAPQQKPFERVKWLVAQEIRKDRTENVPGNQVLATYGTDGKVIEDQVVLLRKEVPPHMQDRYSRDDLVEYLLHWALAAHKVKELGYLKQPEVRAKIERAKVDYWASAYRDSIYDKTFGMSEVQMMETFNENKALLTSDSEEKDAAKFARDIAALRALEPEAFQLEYHIYPDRYSRNDTLRPLDSVRKEIFQNVKGQGLQQAEMNFIAALVEKHEVEVLDTAFQKTKIADPEQAYQQAQKLHTDRKLQEAVDVYLRLREDYPERKSLQDSLIFGLAQIYLEQEKYQDAMAEYRRLSHLFPDSENEYKARFMIGFIYAEHLKKDSAAVRTFRAMLDSYPDTDLSDDADWMIRNIESGGALMPVFETDSAWVDSVEAAKTDSVKADSTVKKESGKASQ